MGFIRTLLALCVVNSHTSGGVFGIGGREAVLLFYVISGFYMAMVLGRNYVDASSNKRFYYARYTRLWLPYIPVLIITLCITVCIMDVDRFVSAFSEAPLWVGLLAVISNIFIVGQDLFYLFSYSSEGLSFLPYGEKGHNGVNFLVNLPLFSVSIELYFYLLAPFFLRSKWGSLMLFLGGCMWFVGTGLLSMRGIGITYHAAPAAFMYFGLGAIAYHLSQTKGGHLDYAIGCFTLLIAARLAKIVDPWLLVFFVCSVPLLFSFTKSNKIDNFIGEFSFLVYIVHYPLLMLLLYTGMERGFGLFIATSLSSVLLSTVLFFSVERYVRAYRKKQFSSGY